MRKHGTHAVPDLRLILGLALAVLASLCWASGAYAQSADDQYAQPVSPAGPGAEQPATVENDEGDDGVVGPGDVIVIPGEYVVADGASVTLQDADGTQGTFVDGVNAVITEGSIIIEVTDDPIINVPGANGVLNFEGLFVVATTGITAVGATDATGVAEGTDDGASAVAGDSAGDTATGDAAASDAQGGESDSGAVTDEESSRPDAAATGVLPDTGGTISLGVLGALMVLGVGGLLIVRGKTSSSR